MLYLIATISVGYFLGYHYAPFPHWQTYFLLWKNILFNYQEPISIKTRFRQAYFLIRYAITCPFFTFLWHLEAVLFADYKKKQITPIFIIGSPRSGTTFLHRLLTEDHKNFFAIRHFEWRYPFILIQQFIRFFGLEETIKKINYWPNTEAGIIAAKMHAQSLYDWEEDGIFFEECFLKHFYILLRFPYRDLLSVLDDFKCLKTKDQQHLMEIHKQVIQKMMYLRGDNKIYLSKEVTSHTKLDFLIKLYPDARFIVNLRSSNEFLSSVLTLIRLSTLAKTDVDIFLIEGFKAFYVERMREEYRVLLNFLKHAGEQNQVGISYQQLTQHPKATVAYIYQQFNLSLSPQYEKYLSELQEKQKQRQKNYAYDKEVFTGFDEFDDLVLQIDAEQSNDQGRTLVF